MSGDREKNPPCVHVVNNIRGGGTCNNLGVGGWGGGGRPWNPHTHMGIIILTPS